MSVNKSLLDKMSTKDLEKYIKPESKFVIEAIEYAFEILENRGYLFTSSDLERRDALRQKKAESITERYVHPDYKKAANIWYISVSLGLINFFIIDPRGIFSGILTLLILFGLGYSISKGYDWMKYLLLVIMIIGLLIILLTFSFYTSHPVVIIINILQTILQIWVLIILFRIPKVT